MLSSAGVHSHLAHLNASNGILPPKPQTAAIPAVACRYFKTAQADINFYDELSVPVFLDSVEAIDESVSGSPFMYKSCFA